MYFTKLTASLYSLHDGRLSQELSGFIGGSPIVEGLHGDECPLAGLQQLTLEHHPEESVAKRTIVKHHQIFAPQNELLTEYFSRSKTLCQEA